MEKISNIDVFFDGACPVCRLEVDLYSKIDKKGAVQWVDITDLSDLELPQDKSRDELLNRFHVRDQSDAWHIGVDAFGRIWRELPVFRYFAFLFSVPGFRQLAGLGYRLFLRWQKWHRKKRLTRA